MSIRRKPVLMMPCKDCGREFDGAENLYNHMVTVHLVERGAFIDQKSPAEAVEDCRDQMFGHRKEIAKK